MKQSTTSRAIDSVLELEHGFFSDGTAAFYERVVADDAMLVVPGLGRLTKRQCVEAAEQSKPWSDHEFQKLEYVQLSDDVLALTYHVVAHRPESDEYRAWMSSIWRRNDSGWQLAAHQQTPA